MSTEVFLLLGSNKGNRLSYLKKAEEIICSRLGRIESKSSIYETAAWGKTDQQSFYNLVINIQTSLAPNILLDEILKIEIEIGRVREEKWGERVIDIDILYYGNQMVETENLVIPHPYIAQRRFTIIPLVEIAPDFIHPKLNISQKTLLSNCEDTLEVKKLS